MRLMRSLPLARCERCTGGGHAMGPRQFITTYQPPVSHLKIVGFWIRESGPQKWLIFFRFQDLFHKLPRSYGGEKGMSFYRSMFFLLIFYGIN